MWYKCACAAWASNAVHCSAGVLRRGQRRTEQGDRAPARQKTARPLFTPSPQSVALSFSSDHFLLLFFLLFNLDQAIWRAVAWLVWDPERGRYQCCCHSLLPFTRAPSGACRTVVWQLRSGDGQKQTDGCYFSDFTMNFKSATTQQEEGQDTLITQDMYKINSDWPHTITYMKVTENKLHPTPHRSWNQSKKSVRFRPSLLSLLICWSSADALNMLGLSPRCLPGCR